MKTPFAALALLLSVSPLAAQDAPKGKAVGSYTPPSCGEPGAALEKAAFELSIPGGKAPMRLIYAGCREEGRNDLIAGFTERTYKGTDGYFLTLVTAHGDGAYNGGGDPTVSEVFVSKGNDWVARMGYQKNAALASGVRAADSGYTLSTAKALPSTAKCEANLQKPIYGPNELWLLTPTKAFYYHEDCDICAQLDSCDLKTGAMKAEITAHMVSCQDAKALAKGEEILVQDCR
jgi:hypothetical protein